LVSIVVELPARLLLTKSADARDPLVRKVNGDPEREGNLEDAAGRDDARHETLDRIDVVVLSVDLEVVLRPEVADADLEPARTRERSRVVVARREPTGLGGDRPAHRGLPRPEAIGVGRIRDGVRRPGHESDHAQRPSKREHPSRPGHQNFTPSTMPKIFT
jgi:hypothetical protein